MRCDFSEFVTLPHPVHFMRYWIKNTRLMAFGLFLEMLTTSLGAKNDK